MGRTALYRDPVPFQPARAEVQLELDALLLRMPDGRVRRHVLDGCIPSVVDGFVAAHILGRWERRFVRMLVLDNGSQRHVVITPPDHGAVAPNVVRVEQAPDDAAIIDEHAWDALTEWVLGGGRLGACAISELARVASIATPGFAALIGEVAAQRALEQMWATRGPLRGSGDLDSALQPLAEAAHHSTGAAEALVSALSHAAGATGRR
jgi:hypothetical protein